MRGPARDVRDHCRARAVRPGPVAAFVEDLRRIDAQLRETKKKLAVAVAASGTSLTRLFGVGPVIAATVIGGVREVAISSCRRGLLNIGWWPSTGVVMSCSQVSMAQTPGPELLAGFAALDCCAVSDGLDALGLPPGVGGLRPMWGAPLVVGFAVTVQVEPYVPGPAGPHIAASAVAGAGPDEVMVIANGARTDVSCWGGLLSLGAQLRGVRAAVVDGACRDVAEAQELGFAVYARGSVPATARGRLRQRSSGEPVVIADMTVAPGDVVVADATGVAFVPRARAAEVLMVAAAVRECESAIAADLRAGVPLPQAMHDARLAADHQTQL